MDKHISSASHDFPTFGAPAKIYRPCASRLSMQNSIGLYTVVMISSQVFELNFFNLSSLLFNFQVSVAFRFNLLCKSHSNFLRTLIKFPISICTQNKKARTYSVPRFLQKDIVILLLLKSCLKYVRA